MVGADATALVAMSLARQLGLVKRLVGKVTVGDITGREITATVRALDPNCELPDEASGGGGTSRCPRGG